MIMHDTPSPIEVHNALGGADFPTTKEHLIEVARHNGAASQVIKTVQSLPRDRFRDCAEVTQAMVAQEVAEQDRARQEMVEH